MKKFNIKGSAGKVISIDFCIGAKGNSDLVLFVHGFKGFKDWGHWPMLGAELQNRGFAYAAFNFSHNGVSAEHPTDFVDLEAFGNNNFSREQEDLEAVLDFLFDERGRGELEFGSLILMGHSRGGACSIIRAAKDVRVKGLITLASIAEYGRFWDLEIVEEWERNGVMWVKNGRTNQDMPLYWQMYEDLRNKAEALDVLLAASRVGVPWLIIHGKEDVAVGSDAALNLKEVNPGAQMFLIDANHSFGGKHPWVEGGLPDDCQVVLELVLQFLGGFED